MSSESATKRENQTQDSSAQLATSQSKDEDKSEVLLLDVQKTTEDSKALQGGDEKRDTKLNPSEADIKVSKSNQSKD